MSVATLSTVTVYDVPSTKFRVGPGEVMSVALLPNPYVPEPVVTEPAYSVIDVEMLEGDGVVEGDGDEDGETDGEVDGDIDGEVDGDTDADGIGVGTGVVEISGNVTS